MISPFVFVVLAFVFTICHADKMWNEKYSKPLSEKDMTLCKWVKLSCLFYLTNPPAL